MYLYAITDRPEAPLSGKRGLGDALLISLAYRNIAAVISPLSTAHVPPVGANVWQHEAAVEDLMMDRTVLPVRFGTVLASEAEIQAVLAAHHIDFVASLDRLRGKVEIGLRILWDDDDPLRSVDGGPTQVRSARPTASSGRMYLLARLERERQVRAWRQRAETLATELHTALARLATESTRQVLVTPRMLLTSAYLVEREGVTAFQREVEALGTANPTLRFLCTGPWPGYSFATMSMPTAHEKERKDDCCA